MTVPNTLREKYTMEREELYETRSIIAGAINELLSGASVTSYTIGNRSATRTRADLNSLKEFLRGIDDRISELEALLSGRALRSSSTYSFIQPSTVFWRW